MREPDVGGFKVLMVDLMCYTPEYDRHLVEALSRIHPATVFAAIDFPLDPGILEEAALRRDPGVVDRVNRWRLPGAVKRPLKGAEYLVNLARLSRRVAREGFRVVHLQWSPFAHRYPFDRWFVKALCRRDVRVVHTVHNIAPHDSGRRERARYRRLWALPDALVVHTETGRRLLMEAHGVQPEKIWVIPHGPMGHDVEPPPREDSRRLAGFADDEVVVLFFGNLRPYKGVEELLEAWRLVQDRLPNARLVIAGGGEEAYVRSVAQKVRASGLEDSVRLELGWVKEERMRELHAASDVLVYPYRDITQSGALVAGMRYGRPIVATRIPGFLEFLEDGKTGPLVPVGDRQALSEALLGVLGDDAGRRRQGQEVKRRWEERVQQGSSWDRVAGMTLECYRSLLG